MLLLRRVIVVAVLWAWLLVLTLTHLGEDSPYSYGWALHGGSSLTLMGAVVNPDARYLYELALFFYEGAPLDWSSTHAQNLRLPLHAFTTSIAAGLTRSHLFASYAANFIFAALTALAAVNLGERYGAHRMATLVALLAFFSLPLYVEYLGQPMHYVVGPAVSFLTILAVVSLDERDVRSPWIAGLATAILSLNYDPYVYLLAMVVWFIFVSRFARKRDYAIYLAVSALPNVLWTLILRFVTNDGMTRHLRESFIQPVISGWLAFVRHPLENLLLPFVASHVGLRVAAAQILAMVYWPLLAAGIYLLIRLRPRLDARVMLFLLLPISYVAEQMMVAGWDWELNPRRAFPVVLAFGAAWWFAADRSWHLRRWRIAFVALMLLAGTLAMSDTLLRTPVMAFLRTGHAMHRSPQEAIGVVPKRLNTESLPLLARNAEPLIWKDLGHARLPGGGLRRTHFAVTQAFCLLLLCALFWLTGRARILPRWGVVVAVVAWVASFARFV